MKTTARYASLVLLTFSMLGSGLAYPGAADLTDSDGSSMKFEYRGDKVRINMSDDEGYMILDDTGLYVVRDADGQLVVIDAGKMMKMFGAMMGSATPSVTGARVVSLESTGRTEELAGIRGEVYTLEYTEDDSDKVQRAELVLSGDERALELSHAMSVMARTIARHAGKRIDGPQEFERRLSKMNMGVLRYGDDLSVTAISGRKIDNSRFVLPAEPQDLSSMAGLAGFVGSSSDQSDGADRSTGKEGSGSLVSGFLSAFSKKPAAEEEPEEETSGKDEEEGNVLNKTLGKLFGK